MFVILEKVFMDADKSQPLTLICNYSNSKIYTLSLDLTNLKVLELNIDIEWAMFIAFNRGKMDGFKGNKLQMKY